MNYIALLKIIYSTPAHFAIFLYVLTSLFNVGSAFSELYNL